MSGKVISKNQLRRLPFYLQFLKEKAHEGIENISSPMIASALNLNEEQVRKDLAVVSSNVGKPKKGRNVLELIEDIETFLGYNDTHSAILVGAGHLGRALLSYKGFASYGLDIVAAFDSNASMINQSFNGKDIFPIEEMKHLCKRLNINIGIIAVPADGAQEACNKLIESGVKAIWNFAPIRLVVPDNIIIQNENMASSLAILSSKLREKIIKEEKGE